MPLFEPSNQFDDALTFHRLDDASPLSTVSRHSFQLENHTWATAEHYYQASSVRQKSLAKKIQQMPSGKEAYRIGSPWYRLKRLDFKQVRVVMMTRALYSKARQNPEVAEFLLDTGERKLVETSLYDHFWGVGRDQRGENQLGQIWMDIRIRLRNLDEEPNGS